MIKVAYISHFSHMKMGGQRSMVHLIENLDLSKILPVAVCPEPGELSEKLESLGCKTFFIPLHSIKPKNYFKVWNSYGQIKRFLKNENIDIVHPDRDADALLFGLAKRRTNTKMVWHVRVNAANPKDKWNFNLSDAVIGVSKSVGNRFKNFQNFSDKYYTIYNGVDLTKFYPVNDKLQLRKKLNLPTDNFILTFVGQVTEGKGVFDLLQALSILKNSNTVGILCNFIGTFGNEEEKMKFQALHEKLNLDDCAIYTPQQSNIHEWMQASDALIIPSHEGVEGMPRVLYEAMACGIVGIGSNTSGVNEAIEDNSGLLIEEKNSKDIAEKIELLMSDKSLVDNFQKKGYERAVNFFDIKKHSDSVMNLYEKIMR